MLRMGEQQPCDSTHRRIVSIQLLTTQQLADACQVPVATIHKWSSQGTGPTPRRVGRHLRYLESDVLAWLDGQVKDERQSV